MTTASTPGVAASSRPWSRPIRPAPSSATFIVPPRSLRAFRSRGRAAPPRGPAARSPRSPTAAPSCCPARPSASRRSRARRATARTPSRSSTPAPSSVKRRARTAASKPRDRPGAQAVEDDRVDVLEVDVGHALAEVAQRRDRVAAADQVVADVEADRRSALGSRPATRRSTSAGVSMNVPPWGWKAARRPAATVSVARSWSTSTRTASQPASVSAGVPGSSARPAQLVAVGRAVEGDARGPRRRRRGAGAAARGRWRARRRSVRRPSPGSTA